MAGAYLVTSPQPGPHPSTFGRIASCDIRQPANPQHHGICWHADCVLRGRGRPSFLHGPSTSAFCLGSWNREGRVSLSVGRVGEQGHPIQGSWGQTVWGSMSHKVTSPHLPLEGMVTLWFMDPSYLSGQEGGVG